MLKRGGMDFLKGSAYVAVALLVFCAVFVAFFPKFYASIDEHTFLKNSLLLREGKIGEQNEEIACRSTSYNDHGYVSAQFVGKSIFLIPFTFFGLNAVMLSGLLIHLLNAFIIFLILRRLLVDVRFTALYLFFPAMLWESRTLFSELLVLCAFLAAFYFYIKQSKYSDLIAGAFFGLAMFVRYDAVVGFAAFAAPPLFSNRKKLFMLVAGFVPVALTIFAFNSFAYSGPLNTGYGSGTSLIISTIQTAFTTQLPNVIVYLLLLLLIPPLFLLSPLTSNNKKYLPQFALLAAAYLILNARFTDFFAFDFSIANTLTARLRYLIPLIGLLIIPYSVFLDGAFTKWKLPKNVIFALALLVFAAGAVYASSVHSAFLDSRAVTSLQIRSVVPQGSLMIGSSDDCIYSLGYDLHKSRYLNIKPEYDLGKNSPLPNIREKLGPDTYIMDLKYSSSANSNSDRQGVVDAERALIGNFIKENSASLELVFETTHPNNLKIYKWIGG